jgi:hypothetical protein
MLIANATLAQALVTKWGTALRASPDYTRIEAPEWSYWLLVAAAALKIVSNGDGEYLAQNLTAILAAPFFFVGLAVAHVMVRRARYPGLALAAFYAMLMFFTWFALVVAAIGFLEPWTRLRERYRSASRSLAPLDEE